MADFDGFVIEKGTTVLFQYDGAVHSDHGNNHAGFAIEKGAHVCFQYDGENFCTCAETTPPIHTSSITPAEGLLTVQFNGLVQLSGPALVPANWFITTAHGNPVNVLSIEVSGNEVLLTTTPQSNAAYTLHLPTIGIASTDFGVFTGLFSLNFTGVPTVITVQMIRAVDTHHIDVIFAIAVDPVAASNPLNYSLDHGLTVTEAVRLTDVWYRIRNDPRQTDGTNYTLVVSNIGPKQ